MELHVLCWASAPEDAVRAVPQPSWVHGVESTHACTARRFADKGERGPRARGRTPCVFTGRSCPQGPPQVCGSGVLTSWPLRRPTEPDPALALECAPGGRAPRRRLPDAHAQSRQAAHGSAALSAPGWRPCQSRLYRRAPARPAVGRKGRLCVLHRVRRAPQRVQVRVRVLRRARRVRVRPL